jgi:hypothetical protein
MADVSKVITGTIPTIMATGLVKHNLKKKKKNLLGLGVDNIVGISRILSCIEKDGIKVKEKIVVTTLK